MFTSDREPQVAQKIRHNVTQVTGRADTSAVSASELVFASWVCVAQLLKTMDLPREGHGLGLDSPGDRLVSAVTTSQGQEKQEQSKHYLQFWSWYSYCDISRYFDQNGAVQQENNKM